MNEERVRELLRQLRAELESAPPDDAESREAIKALDEDIHQMLEGQATEDEPEGLIGRARALEADFATRHPLAERLLREIVDTLSRMGV